MTTLLSTVLRRVFALSTEAFPQMAVDRYGAQDDMDRTWQMFEPVARTLVDSFYATIDDCRFEVLVPRLDAVDVELRGIAYEGAGMGLMLLDTLLPYRRRLPAFLAGPGRPYRSLVAIGVGLVMPRVPVGHARFLARQDPMLRWLVMDGYGFYDGFFCWKRSVTGHRPPRRLHGYALRAYDQGLGRSFWFSTGGDVARIVATISGYPAHRQPDLWSGIGVACAYAAGVLDRDAIQRLLAAAGPLAADLAVGAAVAAGFRDETGHPAPHTELACEVVWAEHIGDRGSSSPGEAVARIASDARADLPADVAGRPVFEEWRRRIRASWVAADLPAPAREGVGA